MFLKYLIIFSVIYLVQSKNCEQLLRELSNEQMLYVRCVTMNSVPVTLCMSCTSNYQSLLKMYDVLLTNCSDIYFDKDRINLIASTQLVLTGLWTKAYCDDCSNNNNSNVFSERSEVLYDCLNDNRVKPCENCKTQYLDLNNFYIKLDQHNNGEVCYDLQDSMNRTRNKWSKELNCCRREQNLSLFMVVLGITSVLPLLFYGGTYYVTKRLERNERVLFNEDPYNSEVPATSSSSSSHQHNINDINNPTQSVLDNLPSSSNADTINAAESTTLSPKNINEFNSNVYVESSDDELLMNSTVQSKQKIKNI